MIDKEKVLQLARAINPYQIKVRRHLHRYPELSNREFATTRFIKRELSRNKIKKVNLKMATGTIGIINPAKKTAIAVRTDIDALPITEQTGLSYKSKNGGVMHACGHDVHMATVLGTAVILNKLSKILPGSVKFFFQPAEELPPGGAERLIAEGALKKPEVRMIFGLHVDPTLKVGKVSFRDGPVMATVIDIDIEIQGTGGHAALPHRAVDAVAVACEVVESIQKVISRESNPMTPTVISFGSIHGGTVRNVIADKVTLSGTARTLDQATARQIPRLIKRTVNGICRARGARSSIDIVAGYPILKNHVRANRILKSCFVELFDDNKTEPTPMTLGGEDFALYLQEVPGAMFRLGVKNDRIGANKSWHSPEFKVDERAIFYGTALLTMSVLRYFEVA